MRASAAMAPAARRMPGVRAPALTAVVLFAFLSPSFIGYVGSVGAVLVNGGLAVLAAVVLFSRSLHVPFAAPEEKRWCLFLLGILTYYFAAICFSTAFLSERVIFRDLFELHKPVLYALSLLLPFVLVRDAEDAEVFERILVLAFGGLVTVAALQLLAPPAFGALYTKDLNIRSGRIAAPFGNPYDFGIGVSFFLYYFSLRYLRSRERWSASLAALALVLCALTQSRTAAIAIVFSLVIFLPLVLLLANARAVRAMRLPMPFVRFLAIAGVGAVVGAFLIRSYADHLAYLLRGLAALVLEGEQASLDVRLAQVGAVWERASTSPLIALFGSGVSKASMEFVESTPAFFLYRYGYVGFVVIFLAPLAAVIGLAGSRVARRGGDRLDQAILIWLLSLGVASMGNAFTEQPRLSFLYYFLLGLVVRRGFLHTDERS